MHPLETYLRDLHDIRSTGAAVKETSYYPPLANLLNAVGQTIKPRVRCVINLRNQGAGMPDGGLFTPDQFQKGAEEPLDDQPPSRGAIECKSTKDNAWVTADTEQVSKYWNKYHQVLVTNYRDFVLVGQDTDGWPIKLDLRPRPGAGEYRQRTMRLPEVRAWHGPNRQRPSRAPPGRAWSTYPGRVGLTRWSG
jgi:hypothetical protein